MRIKYTSTCITFQILISINSFNNVLSFQSPPSHFITGFINPNQQKSRLVFNVANQEEIKTTDTTTTTNDKNKNKENNNPALLPDYGKTSIEIAQHKLEKKRNQWRRKDLYGTSLIDQTMAEIDANLEIKETNNRLKKIGLEGMTREEKIRRRRALDSLGVPSFTTFVHQQKQKQAQQNQNDDNDNAAAVVNTNTRIKRKQAEVLQLNVGLYCNQACAHCHVESSPLRTEMMSQDVASQCLQLLINTPSIHTLDLTGGAPEMNSNFRYLVSMARQLCPNLDIIDRCNLTVLQEPGQEDLIDFLVMNNIHIVASLPCYSAKNVDTQRGGGVFDRSVSGLLALNDVGYGKPDSGLILDLVYNPLGAFLPPPQENLQDKYKEVLADDFGIAFNNLFTMTNMPVKRFADFLHKRGELEEYMDLLVRNFNLNTLDSLMCLNTISVDYSGKIFDCDFNQQLGLSHNSKTIFDISSLNDMADDAINTDNHCFGCTAGMGSS